MIYWQAGMRSLSYIIERLRTNTTVGIIISPSSGLANLLDSKPFCLTCVYSESSHRIRRPQLFIRRSEFFRKNKTKRLIIIYSRFVKGIIVHGLPGSGQHESRISNTVFCYGLITAQESGNCQNSKRQLQEHIK